MGWSTAVRSGNDSGGSSDADIRGMGRIPADSAPPDCYDWITPGSEPGRKKQPMDRVTITADGDRYATLTIPPGHLLHDGPDPEAPQVREFRAANGDAALREVLPDGRDPQVCEQLHMRGRAVTVWEGERTVDVVRREYRAAYRAAQQAERTADVPHRRRRRERAEAADLARRTLDVPGHSLSR